MKETKKLPKLGYQVKNSVEQIAIQRPFNAKKIKNAVKLFRLSKVVNAEKLYLVFTLAKTCNMFNWR